MNTFCNHDWDCHPIPTSFGSMTDKKLKKATSHNMGDYFEFLAIIHNESEIKSGDDINPYFRCKQCGAIKEVDHITRDKNGNITKVVQCKSDHSKVAGGNSKRGAVIGPQQLKEDRKV